MLKIKLHMSKMLIFTILLLIGIFNKFVECADSEQAPLLDSEYICTHPAYSIHLFSASPLVIYISNFITASERNHLLSITYLSLSSFSHQDENSNTADILAVKAHSPIQPLQTNQELKVSAQHALQSPPLFLSIQS